MSALACPADALETYLQNVAQGKGMRAISRENGTEPSTSLRRIRRVEDLRAHPEWDELLTRLEAHWLRPWQKRPALDQAFVLGALGLCQVSVQVEILNRKRLLEIEGCLILSSALPQAAITNAQGNLLARVPKPYLLAALAFGWVAPVDQGQGRVRRFRWSGQRCDLADLPQSPDAPPEAAPAPAPRRQRYSKQNALDYILTRLQRSDFFTATHCKAAQDYQLSYALQKADCAGEYAAMVAGLSPRLRRCLDQICGEGVGLEEFESQESLPARSAKVLIVAALEHIQHVKAA